jgi:hypothetical protein
MKAFKNLNLNPINNPVKKGHIVKNTTLEFGQYLRYKVFAVHSRFGKVAWFVEDSTLKDSITGGHEVIRQEESFEEATKGLI